MEITLCLIVKDEEKNLPVCLESFNGIFKKLVVVDTGSCDKTIDIASAFGAEIFHFNWIKDFSKARNFALSKAKTEWVMMIDADDRLQDQDSLLSELKNLQAETAGVFLPYLYSNVSDGRGTMAFLPRIWRTDLDLKYILPVHEYLNISPAVLKNFIRLKTPIYHHKSDVKFSESFKRNTEILEIAYRAGNSHPRILFYLGHDNFYAGNIEASLKWFKKFLQLDSIHPHEAYKACMTIAKIHMHLNNASLAKKSYLQAIKICPDFLEPHILLGDLAQADKEYEKAVGYYISALKCKHPQTHIFVNTRLDRAYAEQKILESLRAIEPKKA